jgi:prevent-host-death family protein
MRVTVREAKAQFSRLLKLVADGEEVTIVRAGVPIARLARVKAAKGRRPMGMDDGKIEMAADFDAPASPETWS